MTSYETFDEVRHALTLPVTEGEWVLNGDNTIDNHWTISNSTSGFGRLVVGYEGFDVPNQAETNEANARYIVAVNPTTVAKMLKEIDDLRLTVAILKAAPTINTY